MANKTQQVSRGGSRTLTKKEAEAESTAEAEKMATIHREREILVAARNKKTETQKPETEGSKNAS